MNEKEKIESKKEDINILSATRQRYYLIKTLLSKIDKETIVIIQDRGTIDVYTKGDIEQLKHKIEVYGEDIFDINKEIHKVIKK